MPKALRCHPDVPGISGPAPRARGVIQMSRTTRACVLGYMGSSARSVDPLSQATRVWVQGPAVDLLSRVSWARARCPTGSTRCPGRFGFRSEGPRCCPAIPGHSGLGPRAHVFDKLFRANRARVRWPAGSTSSPGRLGHVPQGPGCRPAVSGTSGPVPRPGIIDQLSRVTRARVRGPTVSTRCSRPSGPGPRARRVHQGSRATRTRVRGPAGSTRSPGRVEHMPDAPRGQPDVPGDSGLAPRAHGVTQLSWDTRALDRRTAGSTS